MPPNLPPTSDASSVAASDLTGKTLGNYSLIRRLGRGGMANVYLGRQTTLNRSVAVKVLKPELAVDKSYVDRFHREAQAAAALNQPNIVQIFEIGRSEGIHFIAQEYVRGQNLRQYLNRNQVVEPILAVSIIGQVAAALDEARKQGIVHRDIKPENIMIAATGEVKVTDFGLARVLNDQRADLTQIGITMGTPLYMSPEQAEGGHVDVRSDLYSLGITAWHMFAGRPPFEGENALTIAVKHVKEKLPHLQKIRPDLPAELCDIIRKLAEKKPEDRFQSPALLLKQIRTLEIDDIADWDQLTEKLAVKDFLEEATDETQPQTRLEVTRQLETIMSGQFRPWWKSPLLIGAIGMMLLAGTGAGYLYSTWNPPTNMFAGMQSIKGRVPKFASGKEQYKHAWTAAWSQSNGRGRAQQESLWRSVHEYFPEDLYFNRKAAVQLGVFFLNFQDESESPPEKVARLQKAQEEFEKLAGSDDDQKFKITGLAGKAIAMSEIQAITGDMSLGFEIERLLTTVEQGQTSDIYNDFIRSQIEELIGGHFLPPQTN